MIFSIASRKEAENESFENCGHYRGRRDSCRHHLYFHSLLLSKKVTSRIMGDNKFV